MALPGRPLLFPRCRRIHARVAALALLGGCAAGVLLAHRLPPAPSAPLASSVPVGREPMAVAVDSRAGRVFVANYDDASVTVLDARSGAVLRTVALGQYPAALAVDAAAGRVFTLNSANGHPTLPSYASTASVSVLDARTGALLRTVIPGALPTALAVDARSGHLFVTNSGDATLSMLDARSGRVLRTVALGGWPQALAVDAAAGRVFVGTNGLRGHLVVLDSRTGRRLRALALGRRVGAVLALPRAGRVVVAGDGVLRLLDARRGTLLRAVRAQAVPLVADEARGRVLVAGATGLRLLDARRGHWDGSWVLARRARQPLWMEAAAADAATGRFVVLTQALGARPRGHLYVLDGRTGRTLRAAPAGDAPVAIAVDSRTRHAFVVDQTPADAPSTPARSHGLLTWARRWLPWLPLPWPPRDNATGSVRIVALQRKA